MRKGVEGTTAEPGGSFPRFARVSQDPVIILVLGRAGELAPGLLAVPRRDGKARLVTLGSVIDIGEGLAIATVVRWGR